MITENAWTVRTRNRTSGHYADQCFCDFSEEEAKRHALIDHPNSEVVGVWPWVEAFNEFALNACGDNPHGG